MKSVSYFVFPLVIFLLVLTAGGLHPLIFGGALFYMIISILLFFLIQLLKSIDRGTFKRYILILFVSVFIVSILQLLNTRSFITAEFPQFLFRVCVSITTVFLYISYNRNISNDIYAVLKIVAIHATINFVLGFFLEPYLMNIKVEELIEAKSFLYLTFYESYILVGNLMIFRNQGLFWEPGVLSVFLNVLLYLSLFEYKQKIWSALALLLILTTFSTTGILLVFIQIVISLKSWIKNNLLYFIPALALVALLLPIVLYNVLEKFKSDNGSFIVRLYDYQVAVYMLAENFLTGIGFGNQIYLERQESFSFYQSSLFLEPRPNTNSVVMLLVSFGIPLGGFILYKFYNQTIFRRKNLFFFILIICLSSEPIAFTGFFLFIMYTSFFENNHKLNLNLGK